MEGRRPGYFPGLHHVGVRGVRDLSRLHRSRARSRDLWTRWAYRAIRGGLKGLGGFAAYAAGPALANLATRVPYLDSRPMVDQGRVGPLGRRGTPFTGGYQITGRKRGRSGRSKKSGSRANSVMTMSIMSTGRWKSFSRKMNSLMKAALYPVVERFGTMTNTYDNANTFVLDYATADAGATFAYPVWLVELNQAPFGANITASTNVGSPISRLIRTAATGLYSFSAQPFTDIDNAATRYIPQVEFNGAMSVGLINQGPSMFLDWCDIRLAVQGPRKTPSTFTCELIRWTDDSEEPPCYVGSTSLPANAPSAASGRDGPSGSGDDVNEWNACWQRYVSHLLGNPLSIRAKPVGNKWQVLKRYSYTFQPRQTTDDSITGGIGDIKLIKWFNRVGKTYNFFKPPNPTTVTAAEEINPQEAEVIAGSNIDTHARPRARLFLLISAYTPVQRDDTTDRTAPDVACSFDLLVRKKWYFSERN